MEERRIEAKLSDSIVRFRSVLNKNDNTQQEVHDIILNLQDREILRDEESELVQKILHAFLSLSFIIKSNQEEVEKFIEYYD